MLDAAGNIVREASLPNTRPALARLLAEFPRATVALEAGTHSPWISRHLTGLSAWWVNVYNESHFYFALLTVVTIPLGGAILGGIADLLMGRIGIDLRSRSLREH